MSAGPHIGDTIGFQYQAVDQSGNVIDVSTSTSMTLKFTRPDKSTFIVSLSFLTNGKDGWMQYNSTNTDLNVAGLWEDQVTVNFPNNQGWHSDTFSFRVFPNL